MSLRFPPSIPDLSLLHSTKTYLLPGDALGETKQSTSSKSTPKRSIIRLGPGVMQRGTRLFATRGGFLHIDVKRNKVWVEKDQKRYSPCVEDMIIGVVIEKHSEGYRLDINGVDTASLGALEFEGATKKNRPNLRVGGVVFGRVIRASKDMEAEVSCVEPGSNKSWVGGGTLYGELKGGVLVAVSLGLGRGLVTREDILEGLGERVAFSSAVGLNGRFWIKGADARETVLVGLAVERAQVMGKEEWLGMVRKLLKFKK